MKKIAMIIIVAVIGTVLCGCGSKSVQEQFIAMDTVIAFRADGKQAKNAVEQAQSEIFALEALLSRTRENSEVSVLNRAEGRETEVSEPLWQLLKAAKEYDRVTDGAFDVTISPVCDAWGFTSDNKQVPEAAELEQLLKLVDSDRIDVGEGSATLGEGQTVDLGGIAKGYASDLMQALYERYDITRGTVSLGGNIYVKGTKEDGSLWKIGVQDPKEPGNGTLVGMVGLQDAFAVTSGGYQRYFEENGQIYHHIIDPATGYPAESGLTSVTVIASACETEDGAAGHGTMCDALSTALFVMGEERALEFWRDGELEFELILVTDDDRVVVTSGIWEQFEPSHQEVYTYEVAS